VSPSRSSSLWDSSPRDRASVLTTRDTETRLEVLSLQAVSLCL
jgi:hypothetical protein